MSPLDEPLARLGRSLAPPPESGAPSATPQERRACIATLLRILDNVLDDPSKSNPKVRKIKVANPAFWGRAGRWDGAIAFLEGCGFVPQFAGEEKDVPSHLRLKDDDREVLLLGREGLVKLGVGALRLGAGSLPSRPEVVTSTSSSEGQRNMQSNGMILSKPAERSTVSANGAAPKPGLRIHPTEVANDAKKEPKVPPQSSQNNDDMVPKAGDDAREREGVSVQPKKTVVNGSVNAALSNASKCAAIPPNDAAIPSNDTGDATMSNIGAQSKPKLLSLEEIQSLARRDREETASEAKKLEHERAQRSASPRELAESEKKRAKKAARQRILEMENERVERERRELAEHQGKLEGWSTPSSEKKVFESTLAMVDKVDEKALPPRASDDMASLLNEIENELNDGFFDSEDGDDDSNDINDGTEFADVETSSSVLMSIGEGDGMLPMSTKEESEDDGDRSSSKDDDERPMSPAEERVRLEQNHNAGAADCTEEPSISKDLAATPIDDEPPLHLSEAVEELVEDPPPADVTPDDSNQLGVEDDPVLADPVSEAFADSMDVDLAHGRPASDLLDELDADANMKDDAQDLSSAPIIDIPQALHTDVDNSMQVDAPSQQESQTETETHGTRHQSLRSSFQDSIQDTATTEQRNNCGNTALLSTNAVYDNEKPSSPREDVDATEELIAPSDGGYASLFQRIPLPDGELSSADNEDATRFRRGFEMCHLSLLSVWEADNSASEQQSGRTQCSPLTRRRPSAMAGLSNLRKWGGASLDDGVVAEAQVILVPLEIAYAVWAYLLGLEGGAKSESDGRDAPGAHSGKAYSWAVSENQGLATFSSETSTLTGSNRLPEATTAVCDYVCGALWNAGLIGIYGGEVAMGSEMVSETSLFVGVDRDVFAECTRKRENSAAALDKTSLSQCHSIIAKLAHPFVLSELASDSGIATGGSDGAVLALYACQHAPRHLMESGRLDDAMSLLRDMIFIRRRLRGLGLLEGTSAHCRDCNRMNACISEAVGTWRGKQLRAADVKREQSTSSFYDYAKQASTIVASRAPDMSKWKEDHFKILCSVSLVLRQKVGEWTSPDAEHYIRADSKRRQLQNEVGDALHMIGQGIGDIGVYRVEELEHYEEALQLKSDALGGDQNHESIADLLFVMGCYHQRFQHFKFAQKAYEQALRIYKAKLGYDHVSVARVLHNIGIMYHSKGDNSVALKCLKKSLSIRKAQLGKTDLSVADSHCWIGKIQREKKRFSEARECFEKAHRIKVSLLGKAHVESAEVLFNIGIVSDDLGLSTQSLSCFREALLIRLANVSGPYDVHGIIDVCETLDCIANVYRVKGERKKALQFFEQCLKRRARIVAAPQSDKSQASLLIRTYEDVIALTKLIGKGSSSGKEGVSDKIGTLLVEMGTLYDHRLKKPSKALVYLQKALQVFQTRKNYEQIGSTLSLLGVIHVKRSANAKALKCFRDSLVMRRMSSKNEDLAGIADTLHNIGNCEARDGQFESSLRSYEEALQIKKKVFFGEHTSIAKTEHCMGLAMLQLGKLDAALESFESSLKVRRAVLGDDHLDVSFSLHSLGRIHFHQNRFDSAIGCLEEALKIKKAKLSQKHMSLAESQHLLGSLYIKKGNLNDAVPLLNSALAAYRGSRDCEIIKSDVLDLLGNAYAQLGETSHAILSYEHSLKIKKIVMGMDHVACANVLMEIGRLKSSKDDIGGALVALKEVKRIQKILYGKNHLKNAELLIQVGLIQDRLNNNEVALRCFAEALQMRRKLLGKNDRAIAEALVHTGRMHQSEDHFKALGFFQEAIDIYREVDGASSSEESAYACRLLGLSQMACGDNENALASLERCLDLRESTYGSESEQWAEIAYDLGIARCEAGLYDDAVVLLDKYVLLQKQSDTGSPENVANALVQLGKIYLKKRRVDSAMVCFDEALGIRKQLSDCDIGVSEVLFQIGTLRQSKKQHLESLVCYEESLKLRMSVSEEDKDTADILSRIGEVRKVRGQNDEALENFTLALGMYKRTVGESHPSVATTYHNLGYVCDAKDDLQKAMQNHKEGLSVRKLMLGGDHVKVAASLDDVAGVYQKQNELEKALKCLKEALRIRRLQLGSEDIEIGKTLFGLGIIFAATNDNEKAGECYRKSWEISSRGGSHPKLEAQTLHQIGCLHAANGDYREALQNWRTCLSKYRESGLKDDNYMIACTLGNIEMAQNALHAS